MISWSPAGWRKLSLLWLCRSLPKFSPACHWPWPETSGCSTVPIPGDLAISHYLKQQQTINHSKIVQFLGSTMQQGPLGNNKLCVDLRQSLHPFLINLFKNQASVAQSRKLFLECSHELSPVAWQSWVRPPKSQSSHPGEIPHLAETVPLGFSWDYRARTSALTPRPS